jgi:hypothetical protein
MPESIIYGFDPDKNSKLISSRGTAEALAPINI